MTARTYDIRTYGCQMNLHDSERLAGLLESAGYVRAGGGDRDDVDLVVFNTCAVRENADNRLYGNLGRLYPAKQRRPGMQIAVGGCLAQKDRGTIVEKAPWVDVVFGTHNLASLPVLLERARHNDQAQIEIVEALQNFPSDLPSRRDSRTPRGSRCRSAATTAARSASCRAFAEPRPTAARVRCWPRSRRSSTSGVVEVTLLGQNVNSYGRSFADRSAFGKLLRACGEIEGLERVRFTSPHPRDFTDDVIDAMAETPNVCPQLHMPMQSGSDRILKAMRRSYRQPRYLEIISRVRQAMPDAAITTDIIVGFPGETEEDFQQTLCAVEQARFANAFTFQYSQRPGTPAATMEGQVPKAVVQERYERLNVLQDEIAWDANKALLGRVVEILVSRGEGRKDSATGRVSGRARDGRLVHVATGGADIAPGDVVTSSITYAAPHHLVADGGLNSHRRWRGADAPTTSTPAPTPAGRRQLVLATRAAAADASGRQ